MGRAGKRTKPMTDDLSDLALGTEINEEYIPKHTLNSGTTQSSANMFLPADENPPLILRGETTLQPPHNKLHPCNMASLKRARDIKAQIPSNRTIPQAAYAKQPKKRGIEDEAEKQMIKKLRQEQHLTFTDIADLVNRERRKRGETAEWTPSAVYSCFVRNAPKTATALREIGFHVKDYMHLRNPNPSTHDGGEKSMVSKAGRRRVKDYDDATELKANVRVECEFDCELETVERSEQLVLAVAMVERNFWVLVADEMERLSTRLYKPEALASRYHAI